MGKSVDRRAENIAQTVGEDGAPFACAAWLHDTGDSPSLAVSRLHAIDRADICGRGPPCRRRSVILAPARLLPLELLGLTWHAAPGAVLGDNTLREHTVPS
jgi:hypothetical protein